MKSKRVICGVGVAVVLQMGVMAGSARADLFLYTGSETNVALDPGTYIITAYGASGGPAFKLAHFVFGGLGAEMSAEFNFSSPTNLTLLVGGPGTLGGANNAQTLINAGGGGGGSFVVEGGTPLVVAGGGGGGVANGNLNIADGGNASITPGGGAGGGNDGGFGGTGGYGGSGGGYLLYGEGVKGFGAGGGGGFYLDGFQGSSSYRGVDGYGGPSIDVGGGGGTGAGALGLMVAEGGFGGGGGGYSDAEHAYGGARRRAGGGGGG